MAGKRKKVSVDERKNRVVAVFDTRFYTPESIKSSAEDFEDCCRLQIRSWKDDITVVLSPKSRDINLDFLGYEFYNYVLARMRSKMPG
ncbi:MAG: HxsD-like protein [Candidatus Altiarchaeota archaeon]|nr:HxsD-like protein [Candidatus Altiarchaeota archaeon]